MLKLSENLASESDHELAGHLHKLDLTGRQVFQRNIRNTHLQRKKRKKNLYFPSNPNVWLILVISKHEDNLVLLIIIHSKNTVYFLWAS